MFIKALEIFFSHILLSFSHLAKERTRMKDNWWFYSDFIDLKVFFYKILKIILEEFAEGGS